MVDRKTGPRSAPVGGAIPIGAAVAPSLARASFGDVVSDIGRQAQSAGISLIDTNNAFIQAAKDADNTAVYANSINQATIDYQNLFQARVNEPLDENGNPTFSTLQDDVANIGRDVLETHLNNIQSPEVRAKFKQNFESYASNQQVASISIARNQQLSFISESVSNSVAELGTQAGRSSDQDSVFFENQATDILNSAVQSGAMTPEQRFTAQDAYRKEVATARVRNSINNDPELALETLQNSKAEDLGLRELERLALQNEAQTAVNQLLRGQKALSVEQDTYIKDQLKEFEKIIALGGQIPQESVDNIAEIIVGTEFEPQFVKIMNEAGAINEFTMNDVLSREAIINQLNSDERLNLDGLELRQKLRTINNNLNTKIDNDVYSLAIEQGIIGNPQPFDADGDIKEQLAQRQASIGFVEQQYGVRTSGLTQEEINGFQETYGTSDYQKKASMLGDVVGALGSNAISFLEDLAQNGSTQTAAIGSLMLEGDSDTAVTVLKGQQILRDDRSILPSDYRETQLAAISNSLPFYDLPQQQQDITQMATAIYAALSFESYDFSGVADKDRIETSINQVSNGGAINYNSNNIEPPVNGMTSNEFKKWIRNVTPGQVNQLGGWKGFDDASIARNLRRAQLITSGRGQYLLFLESGSGALRPVLNNNNEAFILDYNVIEGNGLDPITFKGVDEVRMEVDNIIDRFTANGLRGVR